MQTHVPAYAWKRRVSPVNPGFPGHLHGVQTSRTGADMHAPLGSCFLHFVARFPRSSASGLSLHGVSLHFPHRQTNREKRWRN
jgi:hypothetical protein